MDNSYGLLLEQLKVKVSNSYFETLRAVKLLEMMRNSQEPFNKETRAVAHLLNASQYITVAEAIYLSNYIILGRSDIEDIFDTFHLLCDKTIRNYGEDHSDKSPDEYFLPYVKAIQNSPLEINLSADLTGE